MSKKKTISIFISTDTTTKEEKKWMSWRIGVLIIVACDGRCKEKYDGDVFSRLIVN